MAAAALICPGQGAQRVGGLADLPAAAQELFDAASVIAGVDLWKLGLDESREAEIELRRPSRLQPYLVCWAVAEWRAAQLDERVDFVTGHSSGLNAAMVLSGAVTLERGIRFAHACGREMDQACAAGAGGMMALVGASREQAEALAARTGAVLANHNASDQTVLGGPQEALTGGAQGAAGGRVASRRAARRRRLPHRRLRRLRPSQRALDRRTRDRRSLHPDGRQRQRPADRDRRPAQGRAARPVLTSRRMAARDRDARPPRRRALPHARPRQRDGRAGAAVWSQQPRPRADRPRGPARAQTHVHDPANRPHGA